jgi:hypothetical protein
MFTNASTVPATGDTGIIDVASIEDGVPISPQPDGSVSLLMGSVTRRQSWNVDFYDDSGQAIVGVSKDYFNNVAPVISTVGKVAPAIFLPANQAITPTDIVSNFATDVDGDILTVSLDTTPAGLSVSGQDVTGTSPGSSITPANATYTDVAGESATGQLVFVVGPVNPPNLQGLTQPAIDTALAGIYLTATYGSQNSSATPGTAVAQSPPFGVPVQPNSIINVSLSNGFVAPTMVSVPDVSTTPTDQATATAALSALGFTVVVPQSWTGVQKITQYPTAGSLLVNGSVVSLFLAGGSPRIARPRKRMKKKEPKNLQRATAQQPAPYILRRPKRR